LAMEPVPFYLLQVAVASPWRLRIPSASPAPALTTDDRKQAELVLLPPFFQGRRATSTELLDDPAAWRTHRLDTRLHALPYLCPLLLVLLKPEDQQLTPALTSSDPALTLDAGEPNASEGIRGIHGSMADGVRVAASQLSACRLACARTEFVSEQRPRLGAVQW
jgi:hypothetical protein